MHVKPIWNEADYAAALEELDRLWDAEPGTPEHDQLEVLGTVIDDYENRRWPIDPPDPYRRLERVRLRCPLLPFV